MQAVIIFMKKSSVRATVSGSHHYVNLECCHQYQKITVSHIIKPNVKYMVTQFSWLSKKVGYLRAGILKTPHFTMITGP